jgi:hypothetical protein
MGARRRWTAVALEDPRVRIRVGDRIYEQRIVRVTDPALRQRIGEAARAHIAACQGREIHLIGAGLPVP